MQTEYVTSSDGRRIAYDVCGSGPALMLLHGAGKTRSDWHSLGYVDSLKKHFMVMTVDTRGQGESGFLTEVEDYTIDRITEDFLNVADACHAGQFHLWGYSFGGGLARYLSSRSRRIISMIIVGAPFTHATDENMKPFFEGLLKQWDPIVKGYKQGTLSEEEMKMARAGRVPVWEACFKAMRGWPVVKPKDVLCPALLLVGTNNSQTMTWLSRYKESLNDTRVTVQYLEGLDHEQEFTMVQTALEPILAFLNKPQDQ